jgi:hypothetical protein
MARILNNTGVIEANGCETPAPMTNTTYGMVSTGGASGGGSINIFAEYIESRGIITANGGIQRYGVDAYGAANGAIGGRGGNGNSYY